MKAIITLVLSLEFEAHVSSYLIYYTLISHSHLKSNALKAKLITFHPTHPSILPLLIFSISMKASPDIQLSNSETCKPFLRLLWHSY